MRRSGFTLIELIFVIVIIGILAAVAIPKFKYLKTNATVSNIIQAINDINGSGGASAYLNAVELNGVAKDDLNITDIYKFQGKEWTIDSTNDIATYRSGNSDFNATIEYLNNGEVNATLYCDGSTIGQAAKKALEAKGLNCSNTGETYNIKLETQE